MFTTLFGEDKLSRLEYAKLLISMSNNRPAVSLRREPDLKHQISFRTYEIENDRKITLYSKPGIYSIFRRKFDYTECLYVGCTDSSISYRLYRFIKELEDKSRKDEDHPAAKKARKDGVKSTDDLFARYILKEDIINTTDPFYHQWYETIDEYMAYLLEARYNTVKRKF